MRLAVLKERRAFETRVAATPETVKRLIGLGLTVAIEAGAGAEAAIPDAEFAAAGAEIAADAAAALAGARHRLRRADADCPSSVALIPRGALLVCIANAFADPDLVPALAEAGIDCAAMELLPRITRAQAMDVLSSQANLAGYRAVIEAAGAFQRGFPMMMTAAGTVPPARRVRDRRRRGRAAGDRHRPPAGRHRLRHRRPPGRQGGDQVARAAASSASRMPRPPARPAPMPAR